MRPAPWYLQDPKVTADRAFNGYGTNFENSPEPIYGTQFLPRKFKVGVTIPGDNSVDLFTQDLGVIVIMNDKGGPGTAHGVRGSGRRELGLGVQREALVGRKDEAHVHLVLCWANPCYATVCCFAGDEVKGYNIVAGGGLGRTHRDDDTFPRLADPIGWVRGP